MKYRKVLLIGGSLNQTKMMRQIGHQLASLYDYSCCYSPYYGDQIHNWFAKRGLLDWTVMGGVHKQSTLAYLNHHHLPIDEGGQEGDYDLVVTGSDLLVPRNIRNSKLILVQEGMTDPETLMFHLVKWLKLPRYFASTSTNGLSNLFDYFCVASDGYRSLFIQKGVIPEKIIVTGIPNFDHAAQFHKNRFPHHHFTLIATSDARETFKFDNRRKFLAEAKKLAGGRQIIVKLHPNENFARARQEISDIIPDALIFEAGSIEEMIANCDQLICQYSSVAYVGLALGKEVHSYFDIDTLKRLKPIQNDGTSARNIAQICHNLIENKPIQTASRPNENRHSYPSSHGLHSVT